MSRTASTLKKMATGLALAFVAMQSAGCAASIKYRGSASGFHQKGEASYYGAAFQSKPTASGEPFNMHEMTAAHRSLPFGTMVKVVNLDNDREVVVRINDRGPFVRGRIIDVSQAAASALQMIQSGIAPVEITAVGEN